jgi:hypothetical protein
MNGAIRAKQEDKIAGPDKVMDFAFALSCFASVV